MSLGASLRRFKTERVQGFADRIVRETVLEFGEQLARDWTPLGNPELWKSPPPAGYKPGNLQSSWFFSVGSPSTETTERTDVRAVNDLDRMPERPAGQRLYLSNSADHAGAIEGAHSSQAPVGIMWSASEFAPIAYAIARRIAQ